MIRRILRSGLMFCFLVLIFVNLFSVKNAFADQTSDDPDDLIPCAKVVGAREDVKRSVSGLDEETYVFGNKTYTSNMNKNGDWLDLDYDALFVVKLYKDGCSKELEYVSPVVVYTDEYGIGYSFRCVMRGSSTLWPRKTDWMSGWPKALTKNNGGGIDDGDTEITFKYHRDGYDYFDVLFTPNASGVQKIAGQVRVKRYRLYAQAVDIDVPGLISGARAAQSSSVGYTDAKKGEEATVGRPSNIPSGYEFLGWSTAGINVAESSLSGKNDPTFTKKFACASSSVNCADETVYAFYRRVGGGQNEPEPGPEPEPEPEPELPTYKLTITEEGGAQVEVYRFPGLGIPERLYSGAVLYDGDIINTVITKRDGYSWGTSSFISGSYLSNNKNIPSYEVHADVEVSANAILDQFEGKSDAGNVSTGWRNANDIKYYEIKNCDPAKGCSVVFNHYLRRTDGAGSLEYKIVRTSSYATVSDASWSKTESFGANDVRISSEEFKLSVGQTVCETLSFKANVKREDITNLKVCALALGEESAELSIGVKNNNVAKYSSYQKNVYAKPGDKLNYQTEYNPVPQYSYNLTPQQIKINSGQIKDNPLDGIRYRMYSLFNRLKGGSLATWNNAFSVVDASGTDDYKYNIGETQKKVINEDYLVRIGDVGSELSKEARTNTNNTKTTPSKISFTNNGGKNLAHVITDDLSDVATAKVPYNFNTSVGIATDEKILIAGEKEVIKYDMGILPKVNMLTSDNGDAYATIVNNAKSKIILYTTSATDGERNGTADYASDNLCSYFGAVDSCWYEEERNYARLNESGNLLEGQKYSNLEFSINVPDVDAGYKFCVAVALYPASSGSDDNLNASGSNTWRISNSKCFSVGKRPTFQVWGGSFYSANDVATSTTAKRSLNGLTMDGGLIVFSSWVENAVVSNGKVTGLASGAAAGLSDDAKNVAKGGSLESSESYCKYRVPLSLANYATKDLTLCPSAEAIGKSGVVVSGVNVSDFVEDVAEVNDNITLGEMVIGAGDKYIINTTGDVTVSGKIIYADSVYNTLKEIPKVVIAANNINVLCGVERIDAILIAKNKINTCSDSNDLNNVMNSRQLVINGAIFAKTLIMNRTFGAGTGLYSKIPAEIINYDTSMILWGRSKVVKEEYNKVHQVYQHEMAPRY